MPLNLLNEKALNDYLIELVWGHNMPNILDGKSQENLKDAKYLEQNRDTIIRSILTQYMKHRIRAYLTESEEYPFLIPLKARPGLPDWAIKALGNGQKVYEFDSNKMTEQMRHDLTTIRDFLYSAAESYVDKTVVAIKEIKQTDKKKKPKVRLDYLKTSNEYDTFDKTLEAAEKWHKHMAEIAAKKQKNEKMYKESLSGTKFIMDLPNGLKAYQLITPQALDYESEYMGHCVGQGGYDKGVTDGSIKIYSIRDSNGEPHATLEVQGKEVYQCKGKGNKTPVRRYIPAIQKFVETQKLEIKHDMKNVGLIKQDGKYYSIYDLPDGFEVKGDVDLSGMDLRGINLNIKVEGTLYLSRAKGLPSILNFSGTREVDLSNTNLSSVREIKWPTELIYLSGCKSLPTVLDFSCIKGVDLDNTDLSSVREVKWPTESICLSGCKGLAFVLDFSGTKEVELSGINLSSVHEIKWPKESINLSGCKGFASVLDFSGMKEVELSGADLSSVREIKCPTEFIYLSRAYNLPPVLDFSGTKEVDLSGVDLSGVKRIKWPTEFINLRNTESLPSVLDFSKTKKVDLSGTDLSSVREIKLPTEFINLSDSYNLPPFLDFSKTKEVILDYADLSEVKKIKGATDDVDLSRTENLPSALDFSKTKKVNLSGADLSGVKEIKWPIEECNIDTKLVSKNMKLSYAMWKVQKRIKNGFYLRNRNNTILRKKEKE